MFSVVRTTLNSKHVTSQERAHEDKSNFMAQSLQWNFFHLLEQGTPCLNSAPGPTCVGALSLCQVYWGSREDPGVADRPATVFSSTAADSLTTLPDPTTLATLSRVPVPACWGQLAQTHTTALAALCTCFSNKGASISKVFFQSIAKKIELFFLSCGAMPATKMGESNSSSQRSGRCWDPAAMLLHRPHELKGLAGYFSGCLCAITLLMVL